MLTPKTPNMKTSKKIKFKFLNETFELPSVALRNDNYNGTYIHMGAKHTASVIKQYVKKKYGNRITVWSTSDVYSGGSSVRVNVWSKNGSPTPLSIYEDIKNFANQFKAGYFDGMYDIYEYVNKDIKTDKGTQFKYFPSYVFVDNKPKWDSVEYWLNEWKNFDESNYEKLVGKTLWEKFINRNSNFWKKGTLEKLTKYMNELHKELISLGYTEEEIAA